MPSISRLRIVNFRYNDGKRLIPDEIISFADDMHQTLDTLINMDNGGGKSVMVQLMLQAVCPQATVQRRRISEYFCKASDHAYILLEWKLDHSADKLLTGIAIAAGQHAGQEKQEEEKQTPVRYFTFVHSYGNAGDRNDIVNMPLSEQEEGKFRPAPFEEIRKLVRSHQRISYYHSDDHRKYYSKLEEYGILHTEWENIITKINAVEGGVDKFFEAYKTTNSLLDQFIIPGISTRQEMFVGEGGSVERMLLNYADSYRGQKERIHLKTDMTAFTEKLQTFLPEIRRLWKLSDEKELAVHQLFNYIFSVTGLLQRLRTEAAEKGQCIHDLAALIQHIRLEEISEKYYQEEMRYRTSVEHLQEMELQCRLLQQEKEHWDHQRSVLLAAREYQELREQEQKADALLEQIRQRKAGSQDAYAHSLQYSLHLAAKALLAQLESEHQQKKEQLTETEAAYAELSDAIAALIREQQRIERLCNEQKGGKSEVSSQIDRSLDQLGIQISRSFTEDYAKEDIERAAQQLTAEREEAESCLLHLNEEESALDAEQRALKRKQKQHFEEITALKQELQRNEEAQNVYQKKYAVIQQILTRISMASSCIFNGELLRYLEKELAEQQDLLHAERRKIEQLQEQLDHAQKGQLHLPKSAIHFLDETGISYETGEHYLHSVDKKRRNILVFNNPTIAYSIIVDSQKDRETILKLAESASDVWISAAVPIFSQADIERMLHETFVERHTVLAAYSRPYFASPEDFTSHLTKQIDQLQDNAKRLESRISGIRSEIEAVSAFDYGEQDYKAMLAVHQELKENMQELMEVQQAEDERLDAIASRQEKLRTLWREADNFMMRVQNRLDIFTALCSEIERYNALCVQYETSLQKGRRLDAELSEKKKQDQQLTEQRTLLSGICSELSDRMVDCRNILEETAGAAECEQLDKSYAELKAEYAEYHRQLANDMNALHRQLDECREKAEKHRKELACRDILEEEFVHTAYSAEAYREAEQKYKSYAEQYEALLPAKAALEADARQAKNEMQRQQRAAAAMEGVILPRTEIGSDFQKRQHSAEQQKRDLEQSKRGIEKQMDAYENKLKTARKTAEKYATEKPLAEITVREEILEEIIDRIQEVSNQLSSAEACFSNCIAANLMQYADHNPLFKKTLAGVEAFARNTAVVGDKYFTLYEKMEKDIQRYQSRIQQLTIELQDIAESRMQLVTHCLQRGQRLYDNLKLLANKSKVSLSGHTRQMLKITLPEIEGETESARLKMEAYIDECVDAYLSEAENMRDPMQYARKCMNFRRLLNCFIGREEIAVYVYKIDITPQNSGYRTWEKALKANSGGEKFVILFALILSMMNYTRGVTDTLKKTSGVLIMDNPFGPISSAHLLRPMFEIARHFRIQLICFSHLDTTEIRNCFRNIYQMKMKHLPLSSMEIVEAEPIEHMEHAFYREKQLALF